MIREILATTGDCLIVLDPNILYRDGQLNYSVIGSFESVSINLQGKYLEVYVSEYLGLPSNAPVVDQDLVTESSAVIRWKEIINVPADLSDYYQYVIEYTDRYPYYSSTSWSESQTRHSHDLLSSQYQDGILAGLTHYKTYYVRVKSYRILHDDREETGVTSYRSFKTKCTGG